MAQAREFLGVSGREDLQTDAELVLLADDNTPFLSGQVIGHPVWHVVISDWKLQLKSAPPDVRDRCARTFDVFLGAQEGCLLKIVSRWPKDVPPIPPEPGPASYTDQLRRSGDEKYHGFPKEKSSIQFVDALDSVLKNAANPLAADQIVGQYVVWSQMGRDPKPVWAVTLRDTDPLWEASYPGVSVDARNHLRCIVDAKTGEFICGGSVPQPEEKEKEKGKK
ncbi:MAG: hypothetical protein V2A79_11285 [Planctomycetota bacterium]